jgi:predicted nucleic acid-binding protein
VLVLDTGPLFAALDTDDPDHDRCANLVQRAREELVIPAPVLVELDYFVRKLLGVDVWGAFVEDIGDGAYRIDNVDERTLRRAADLERAYESLSLGLVDASVIATCERLGETKVATLDRRHFSVVRPNHCEALTLLPQ